MNDYMQKRNDLILDVINTFLCNPLINIVHWEIHLY